MCGAQSHNAQPRSGAHAGPVMRAPTGPCTYIFFFSTVLDEFPLHLTRGSPCWRGLGRARFMTVARPAGPHFPPTPWGGVGGIRVRDCFFFMRPPPVAQSERPAEAQYVRTTCRMKAVDPSLTRGPPCGEWAGRARCTNITVVRACWSPGGQVPRSPMY